MTQSIRFSLSLRVLSALARARPAALTSADLAAGTGAHPVAIRRLLGRLARAGLTEAKSGRDGGARLAVAPKRISLRAVWEAAEPGALVARAGPGAAAALPEAADRACRKAEKAFLKTLEETTLRDIARAGDRAAADA